MNKYKIQGIGKSTGRKRRELLSKYSKSVCQRVYVEAVAYKELRFSPKKNVYIKKDTLTWDPPTPSTYL